MSDKPVYITRSDKSKDSGTQYARIDNRVIDDTNLSPLARLALVHLLSKPDTWQVNDVELRRYLEVGIHKLEGIIAELKNAGYITRTQYKNDKGHWVTSPTYVFELPELNNRSPIPGEPLRENGNGRTVTGEPELENISHNGLLVTTDELTTDVVITEGATSSGDAACIAPADDVIKTPVEIVINALMAIGAIRTEKTARRDAESLLKTNAVEAIVAACELAKAQGDPTTKYIRGILKNKAAAVLDNTAVGIYRRETGIKGEIKPGIVEWLDAVASQPWATVNLLEKAFRKADDGNGGIFSTNHLTDTVNDLRTPVTVEWQYPNGAADKSKFTVTKIKNEVGDIIPFNQETWSIQRRAITRATNHIREKYGVESVCTNPEKSVYTDFWWEPIG